MAEIYYIQVIRKCNQSCRFCSNPSNDSIMPLEEAKRLLRKYAEAKAAGVIFTGGEPTMYPFLPQAIRYAAGLGLFPRITTNGQLFSDYDFASMLVRSGLSHAHFSIYSHRKKTHEYLTRTPGSHAKLLKAIENAGKLGVRADINTVINKYNSKELHLLAKFIIRKFPFVSHIVFNNMDPGMDRAVEDKSTVPVLSEFEASLAMAMRILDGTGRTFRVERVPLCFMSEFPQYSTETRKIIKQEDRRTFFLDEKKMVRQTSWEHGYGKNCQKCGARPICAGLFEADRYYSSEELCPVFYDIDEVRKKVLAEQ